MRTFFSLFSLFLLLASLNAQEHSLQQRIMQITENKKAQIGVAVIINGKDTITVNNEMRYPMMSVFKMHQAMAVIHDLETHKQSLDTPIFIKREQLHPNTYSPLRDKYPQGELTLTIRELLIYTLQSSDNNACDILFDYIGGTTATDKYIRSLGITDFQICATEDEMHHNLELCYQNWTSPLAAACLAEQIITRPLFTPPHQEFLRHTMMTCETGKDRLPHPLLHTQAVIGHKTGTGDRNEKGEIIGCNDVGFILLPDGRHYTLAVFICNSSESDDTNTQIISDISAAVYQYVCP